MIRTMFASEVTCVLAAAATEHIRNTRNAINYKLLVTYIKISENSKYIIYVWLIINRFVTFKLGMKNQ